MPAVWEAGTLTVPSSTGNVTVTGLAGQPQIVLFFGTNWLTEDATVSTSGTAIFRGMACLKWDDPGTILQHAGVVGPTGDQHATLSTRCIVATTTAGSATGLYEASLTSFNSDGFTVNFAAGASGGYKVVWCAMHSAADAGAFQSLGASTVALGWKAGAAVMQGNAGGAPSFGHGDRTLEYFGSAAYPGTLGGATWMGAGLTCHAFPPASNQYASFLANNPPGTNLVTSVEFIGPALTTQNVTLIPTGTGLNSLAFQPNVADNWAMVAAWDDEDSMTGRQSTTPASNGNTDTEALAFDPGLVLGYTNSDEPSAQGSGGVRGAVGFSVATETFQWCAVADGVSTPRTSYQSFQRGFVDTADAGDVHAGTVTLHSNGFTLETDVDDASPGEWVWHAFGHPRRENNWVPQIYRRRAA